MQAVFVDKEAAVKKVAGSLDWPSTSSHHFCTNSGTSDRHEGSIEDGVGVACEVLSDNMLIEKHLGDLGVYLRSDRI